MTRKQRRFLYVLFSAFLCLTIPLLAAEPHKIAIVKSKDLPQFNSAIKGFKKGLQDGKVLNTIMEYDISTGNKQASENIKKFGPDLIVPVGSTATKFAQEYFKNTPIVFTMVLYPVLSGVVPAAAPNRPNITGASMDIPIMDQFKTIREVIPRATKIGVLYDPNETGSIIDEAIKVAQSMGLNLVAIPTRSSNDVPAALQGIERKVDVLWAVADGTVFTPRMSEHILTYTIQHNLAFMGLSPAFVEAGASFALSQDFEDIGKQTAEIAIRILAGASPQQLEITYPRRISLLLNLRTAEEIGVRIPETVIRKAAKVIR